MSDDQLELLAVPPAPTTRRSEGWWRDVDAAVARSQEHFDRTKSTLARLGWRLSGVDDMGRWCAWRPKEEPLSAPSAEELVAAVEAWAAREEAKARTKSRR